MTLRPRLLLAQAPLAAALLVVAVVSLRTVSYLGGASENILRDNYRSLLAAQRMTAALDVLDRNALLRAAQRAPVGVAARMDLFETELRLQEGNITEPGEAEATARLRAAWESYKSAYLAAATIPDALSAYTGPLTDATSQVRSAIDEVVALNQEAMARKSANARQSSKRLLQVMMAATALALTLGLFASFALTTRIVRPLSRLSLAVRRFGEGQVDVRAKLDGRDEIAALARDFDTMADKLAEYRKSSLGELLQAQQASQTAIDSLPDPVLIVDPEGRVLNLNRAAESLLGHGSGQEVGTKLQSLDPPLRERLEAVSAHVLEGRGPFVPRGFDEAIRVEQPDGPRQLLPRATALYSLEGAISGVSIVLQDVTRLMRFDELKNDLVATVAHEFRTPLTSLRMAIHLVAEEAAGPLTEKQADLVAAARQDCERLQGIVDDVLDMSRVTAGRIELNTRQVDGRSLLKRAAAGIESAAREAGVLLSVETPDTEVPVLADPERIDIVVMNLLGNALRHTTPRGRITTRIRPNGSSVRFEVEDAGDGVPRQYQERIFERFFQMPGAKRGGLGLGLYISREIVRAHGGEMGVESEEGKGSTFWFTLPVAKEPSPS